jgi:AcrR family transcriptional regulator
MTKSRTPVVRRTQQERREGTRKVILDAALDQLVASGLAEFTTTEVGRRAGVSQGAVFKHFPTKPVLLVAVAEHLFETLRAAFETSFIDLAAERRTARDGLELLWEQMLDPRLAAAYELHTAARSNAELREGLRPAIEAHLRQIDHIALSLFPQDAVRRSAELMILAMQGLVINHMVSPDDEQLVRVRETLDHVLIMLLTEAEPSTTDASQKGAS